ncbi:MAG: hypothetical protein AAGK00_18265 [Pseudomonadota bacterium]
MDFKNFEALNRHALVEYALQQPENQTPETAGFPIAPVCNESSIEEWVAGRQMAGHPMPRRVDWKADLERLCDRWSGFHYDSGNRCCFTFACAAIDTLIGTNLFQTHRYGWCGAGNFWNYIGPKGGRDYFNCIGTRIHPDDARLGDLIQMETRHGDRIHAHWAISSGSPSSAVCFDAAGIAEAAPVRMILPTGGRLKAWRIGDIASNS